MPELFHSTTYLDPKESGKWISSHSKNIKIDDKGIEKCAVEIIHRLKSSDFSIESLYAKTELHPQLTQIDEKEAVDWVFFLSTLNFSFWTEPDAPQYEVTYNSQTYSGYLSLCAALKRSLDGGIPLINPTYYGKITESELGELLVGNGGVQCPLLNERVRCLQGVSKVLIDKFSGSFVTCLRSCENSAVKLLQIVLENFECFKDVGKAYGKDVSILKRAQILISDIWALFEGKGLGHFHDIDSLSMFADYRVPQSLQYFGVLLYSNELVDAINTGLLPHGSEFELEIRGCSIAAVEKIVEVVRKKLLEEGHDFHFVNSASVDYFLWGFRREKAEEMKRFPYHKTRSIYY